MTFKIACILMCSFAAFATEAETPDATKSTDVKEEKKELIKPAEPTTQPIETHALPPETKTDVPLGGIAYYCNSASAYYPHTKVCLEGWIAVPEKSPFIDAKLYTPTRDLAVSSRPNSMSFEIFGKTLFYSFNFERALTNQLTLGLGISSWDLSTWLQNTNYQIIVVPFINGLADD